MGPRTRLSSQAPLFVPGSSTQTASKELLDLFASGGEVQADTWECSQDCADGPKTTRIAISLADMTLEDLPRVERPKLSLVEALPEEPSSDISTAENDDDTAEEDEKDAADDDSIVCPPGLPPPTKLAFPKEKRTDGPSSPFWEELTLEPGDIAWDMLQTMMGINVDPLDEFHDAAFHCAEGILQDDDELEDVQEPSMSGSSCKQEFDEPQAPLYSRHFLLGVRAQFTPASKSLSEAVLKTMGAQTSKLGVKKWSRSTNALVVEGEDKGDTLRTTLRVLSDTDSARVLMLRRINHLGSKNQHALWTYFSRFGLVERVMVTPTFVKSKFNPGEKRIRPATVGFLVMSKDEDAHAALAAGSQHEIQGVTVTVHPFVSHNVESVGTEAANPANAHDAMDTSAVEILYQ